MSLEKVVEEILERGRAASEEIAASTKAERDRLLADVREKAKAAEEDRTADARERANRERLREVARAELDGRRMGLQAQKDVLDEVLVKAKAHLQERPADRLLLEALLARHPEEVADGILHCSPRDAPILKTLVPGEVRDDLETIGGILIESLDGKRRVDLTYETALEDLWPDIVKEIATLLWRKED